jgi:SprT protein
METQELKQIIISRFHEVRDIASEFYNFDFSKINCEIHWDLTGVCAGRCCYKDGKYFFRVNLVLAEENLEDYLAQVIPHEYAHFIVISLIKDYHGSHGSNWQGVMIGCFKLNPDRCHKYDLSSVRESFEWHCPICNKKYDLTKKRHNDMMFNRKTWGCGKNHKWTKLVQYGE